MQARQYRSLARWSSGNLSRRSSHLPLTLGLLLGTTLLGPTSLLRADEGAVSDTAGAPVEAREQAVATGGTGAESAPVESAPSGSAPLESAQKAGQPDAQPAGGQPDVAPAPASAEKPKDYRTGTGYAGLPLANFDSDDGFGYGVKVARYDYGENQRPYKTQLSLQLFFTSKGAMYHELFFDAPNLGGTPWRVDTYLKLDRVLLNGYYGIGNNTRTPAQSGDLSACLASEDFVSWDKGDFSAAQGRACNYYTSFQKLEPKWILNLRRNLEGPWKLFNGAQVKFTNVIPHSAATLDRYADGLTVSDTWQSLLEQEKPYGYEGGVIAYVQSGILFDARDEEASPKKGVFSELSARGAFFGSFADAPVAGTLPVYGGLNLTSRHYLTILPYTVLATRLVGDFLFGDVPFFELTSMGGSRDYSAIGGSTSGRGIPAYRYRGKIKVILTPELRFTPIEFYGGKQKFNISAVAFSDLGRVWADYAPEGELLDLKLTYGGGIRFAWNDNFLIRLDYGIAPQDDSTGFYLTFNQAF